MNCRADQQRLQISDLPFDKIPTPATFACWKINAFGAWHTYKRGSLTEAMCWIKEVELVDSVDGLRALWEEFQCRILKCSMRGLLQHWTKSSTFPSSKRESVWRSKRPRSRTVSFAEDRSPTWSGSTSGSLEQTILSRIMPTCSQVFFDMMMFRNSIENGMKFLLSMTQISSDDILEGLYKLRKRESDKLKTVLELYDLEIHQKKAGPDYHRLKIMVKGSIEQEIRNKNFGARSGNFEKNAVVKNPRTKQRGQRILGDCWQWETNGQCVKGDNCSFQHDVNNRGKMT